VRWLPGDGAASPEKLLPPLVTQLRRKVKEFRASGYVGATATSKSLLTWWFATPHLLPQAGADVEFQYYFAQREAVGDDRLPPRRGGRAGQVRPDALRQFGAVATGMFDETWRRFVVKMATGAGKTKVLSLILAWSFFHKILRTGLRPGAQFSGDHTQHHRARPHLP
jgi:type III restriction enzyme